MLRAVTAWFDSRLRATAVREFLAHKQVPNQEHAVWYYLGGVTLFLYGVQVATGVLLLLYYRPAPESAFESVRFIVTQVPFGWLVRSIHAWAANLMVAAAFAHFFSVFFLKAYRAPREPTWMSGCLLLLLTMAFGFSGYLLPWNELAFFATKVGTDIVGAVPGIGGAIRVVARGGAEVTGATLTRFFGIHVALLPLATTGILLGHLALVQVHGMSEPTRPARSGRSHLPFYPDFMLREALLWLVVLALLVGLATFLPWELGHKADPFASAPEGIRPEWYFTFMSQSFKYVPPHVLGFEGEHVAIVVFGLIGLAFFVVPFVDRERPSRTIAHLCAVGGMVLLAFMGIMSALAYLRPY